ncbi:tetratricopeptide repeat protein [Polynucleobacter sp. MWH-UH24A]|uniref:YfgM family protein n=1 Tax=Polynucleobacter sp. MWH-UH24A TaxID=2689110 RepID=UPI001BFDAC0B|nr:tetratricopeptide repeat protein [Polynucleobacter sp. MWH-UH24A]QWD75336.1 tetratricopeptide repeat protein [Polynucleobacter sp. MWH-UH24A]
MALDLEEQENLANLKSFWARYGNYIIGVITVALLVYSGMSAWKWYQRDQAADAGKLYETLINSISKNEKDKTYLAAEDLQNKYGGTSYAAMGSLVAAKVAMDSNDATKAQSYLKWTANQASDDSFRALAQLRLLGILIDQGTEASLKEADQLLKEKAVKGFEPLWIERRGDWYLVQTKIPEARTEYLKAMKAMQSDRAFPEDARGLLKVKIDAVGGM